ncbi:LysR family transcriptional regulator [Burkholderia sp. Bp8963]|uniref:LysR family transcriptional regulator n=1 Tax=Burkholderia sp. Bp8963 TaxID=2184547 RepID=UPI000F5A635F|nr:LysR family transcriptional regulator [Burkholderia sp. Bp8963]RQS67496.1 LysR family transcriptional regulator [Burkholderia sp. Bp8963]
MDDLRVLESFLRTVETGSFSAAAGRLGVTPAAVSKHVAKLERSLGTRLFRRTTRSLTLTEAGERLYAETSTAARALSQAMATLTERDTRPAGTLRLSVAPGFGRQYVLPLMPAFLERYPDLRLDWSFENRHVDLVKEGFDAAIGSGVEDDANVVARELVPIRLLTVASPAYLAKHGTPATLADLSRHDCIRLRSATTGRVRDWAFTVNGAVTGSVNGASNDETVTVPVDGRVVLTDLDAICDAAVAGMGLARLGVHHVLPHLDAGRLVCVLTQYPATVGTIHVYYAHARLTPPKVRAFVEFLTESFAQSAWRARVDTFG